ncbi:MAG TPA: zinc ABC transporter substrate-binding protein [Nitrososphaeraceae archaeon]|nr:zinc ABC transporter substrate-binding protein [Nitrososphaeraceae archaeon]
MNEKRMALVTIAIVIPLIMIWVAYSGGLLSPNPVISNASQIDNSTTAQSLSASQYSTANVVASFFPLYDFARHVGGNKVNVTTMVPVGVEPHDWEPTTQQIQGLLSADLLVYNGAGIDKWADKIETKLKVNASEGLPLLTDDHRNHDPHTWLDPLLAKRQVELIRNGLIKADPQNTDYYIQNAQAYLDQLDSLDAKIESELSTCTKTDFLAFHSAFSYFSNRYGLHQHTILGEDPEGEIRPQNLERLVNFAKQYGIHVIYSEDLLDPRNAQVIADEIPNGKVLVLSPIEGVNKDEQNAGIGYLEKMQQNLENLKQGLDCK